MSEYYQERRTQIADVTALVGLGVAALVTSLLNLKVLATGFRTGNLEPALLRFGVIVVAGSVAGGALGLLAGRWGGSRWERRHRARRPVVPEDVADPTPVRQAAVDAWDVRDLSLEAQRALGLRDGEGARWIGAWRGDRLLAMAPLGVQGGLDEARLARDPAMEADEALRILRLHAPR